MPKKDIWQYKQTCIMLPQRHADKIANMAMAIAPKFAHNFKCDYILYTLNIIQFSIEHCVAYVWTP